MTKMMKFSQIPGIKKKGLIWITSFNTHWSIIAGAVLTLLLLHQKWQQRVKVIRKEHIYETYGRFIPGEWVPAPSLDDPQKLDRNPGRE